MPDPIQVERNFQEVNGRIESSLSIRHRYRLFGKFIDMLEGAFKKYESYIVQLLDEMPLYSTPLTWTGMDPMEIENDLIKLEKLQARIALSEKSEKFNEIKSNLQEVCLLLFCCLNDAEKIDYYLKKVTGLSWLDDRENNLLAENTHQTIYRLYNQLSLELEAGTDRGNKQQNSVQRLHKQLTILLRNKGWNVFIPVAEKYENEYLESSSYGRLRKMTVELYGETETKTGEELVWTSNIYGAEVPALGQTTSPVKAARNLFEFSFSKKTNKKYYRGGIRFENTAAIHDGQSANLAIAALWYTHLLKANGHRERYYIHSNTALTGDIDASGCVQPVDDESIGLKARAVFFSWVKCLVIPVAQRDLFESEIQKLQQLYPNRILPIVGVNYLREVFYDRRAAVHHIQGRIPYLLNRIKSEYSKYILVPTIIILLLIITRLVYGPVDRNAVALEFIDNHIALKNNSGNVIQRIESNESTRLSHSVSKPNAILYDLTGDGKNELIYSNRLAGEKERVPKIRVWSITGDSLIWEKELTLNYDFPRQNAPLISELRPLEVDIASTTHGQRIVVHTGSSQYFQGVIFVMNAQSGELISEYVHTGQIRDMIVMDMNNDNEDDIILTGVNNAFWNAFVSVLSVNNAHGYSPTTPDYQPTGISKANEMIYVRIPKTIIGKYVEFVDKYNQGRRMIFNEASDILMILVVEGWRFFNDQEGYVETILYFDRSIAPVGVGTSDAYDVVAKQLFEEGEIQEIPGFDYFEAYQDSILYWNGEEFLLTHEFFKN